MCSASASIPVILFFTWLAAGRMLPGWLLPLFSCMAFYSPLAAVGGLPLIVCEGIREWKAGRSGQAVWSVPAVLAAAIPGICFLIYYGHVNAPSSRMACGLSIPGGEISCSSAPPFSHTRCSAGATSGGIPLPLHAGNRTASSFPVRQRRRQRPALQRQRSGHGLPAGLSGAHLCPPSLPPPVDMDSPSAGAGPRFNLPYYFSAPEPMRLHLKNLPAPDGWTARELRN